MKNRRIIVNLSLAFILAVLMTQGAISQNKPPSELNDRPSITELLASLNRTIPTAQLGLSSTFPDPEVGEVITDVRRYSESVEFAQGFKLSKIEGCRIELTNDNAKFVSFWTKNPDPKKGSFQKTDSSSTVRASFIILLNSLSEKGGKGPFEWKKKGVSASGWRTEYRLKNGRFFPLSLPTKEQIKKALQNPPLKAVLAGSGQNGRDESMTGDTLLFLFDSKDKAKDFDTSFRSAVRQCQ